MVTEVVGLLSEVVGSFTSVPLVLISVHIEKPLHCFFRSHQKEIADRLENPLEEGTPLFQLVFERCLSQQYLNYLPVIVSMVVFTFTIRRDDRYNGRLCTDLDELVKL